jgi:hypothetical protein
MYTFYYAKKEIWRAGEKIISCATNNQNVDEGD